MSELIFNKVATPPSTPGAGESSITVNTSGAPQVTDGDTGITSTFKSIFGSNVSTASKQVLESTTNTSGSIYLSMPITITASNAGIYMLQFNYYWGYSAGGRDYIGEIRLNGSPLGEIHRQEPKDAGTDQRYVVSGLRTPNLGVGVHLFEFFYQPQTNGDTARTYQCELSSFRMS